MDTYGVSPRVRGFFGTADQPLHHGFGERWALVKEAWAPTIRTQLIQNLVRMLGPKPSPKRVAVDADELPETEIGAEGDGGEIELPEAPTPQNLGRLWASSMGLSFAVPADLDTLAVTACWGEYAITPVTSSIILGILVAHG